MFITFEGPDGCGKSALIKHLVAYLKQQGYHVCHTFEPGDKTVKVSVKIRELVLHKMCSNIDPLTAVFLFSAARNEHLNQLIIPSLKTNKVVVCDRYVDSTIVYQSIGKFGVSREDIEFLNYNIMQAVKPDLTFVILCDYNKVKERVKNNPKKLNYFDVKGKVFFDSVKKVYINLAKSSPRYQVIFNNSDIKNTLANILQIVSKKLEKNQHGKTKQ